MTLYSETPVNFPEPGSISVNGVWHPLHPLLAVASFSQDSGGFAIIFDELGDFLKDVNYPTHRSYQITALAWHPEKTILVSGWENGELKVWNSPEKEFVNVIGPHKAPICLLEFSEKGGRLVSCDSAGSVVGWKVDSKGDANLIFHLDLKEAVTHLTFRLTVKNTRDYDVEGLAKAAVNGDQHALDMFSNWRPKTTARKFRVQDGVDNLNLFVATQAGSIHYINNNGSCTEVLNTQGVALSCILHHPSKDSIIVMMDSFTIGHFSVDFQGNLTEITRVKLSGRMQSRMVGNQGLVWAGHSSLAVLTGDLIVRVWDIQTNDNYVLPTAMKFYDTKGKTHSVNEIFTCIAYCKTNQTLCAGTNIGRIYFWTKKPNADEMDNPEDSWELTNINTISGTIKQLMWGTMLFRMPLLSVNCVTSVFIMKEQSICNGFHEKIWAVQKNTTQILVETEKSNRLLELQLQVNNMAVSENMLVFTNSRNIFVYDVIWKAEADSDFTFKQLTTFNHDNDAVILYDQTIISLNSRAVTLHSSSGAVLATLTSGLSEGEPIGMHLNGRFLTVFTMEGYLKVYDVSEHQPKLLTHVRNLYDMIDDFGEIIQAKVNAIGSKVALTLAGSNLIPDGKLYIWDIEKDDVIEYNFRKYDAIEAEGYDIREHTIKVDGNSMEEVKSDFDEICRNRIPLDFYWDTSDPRLLVCSAKKLKIPGAAKGFLRRSKSTADEKSLKDEDHVIVTMWVSPENAVRIHNVRATESDAKLLACATPYVATLQKLSIAREVMNDFVGLENCDKNTRHAVLDFSYNLTVGNMDAAFKAIKLVRSVGVWASLARVCVKTRRLDVAGVCLGHVGDAKAARALRMATADETLPLQAKVAVLAVHLGMLDEAEQLYIQCNRYDLLNKLLRSRNKMDAAHAVAESKDRINLRNTDHAWARYLEQQGDFKEAAVRYEKANTHVYDIPRMLSDHPQQLRAYMSKTKDKELLRWWGQYIESQGDMSSALKMYANSGDVYSQVRVLCFLGKETAAADLARANADKAAFYHMARYYETVGNYEESVNFFTKATAYCNAVRLCKENDMSEELWDLASVVAKREKIECAEYFELRGDLEKSVTLYHRGGMLHKALDLAFRTSQYDIVQDIATQLDARSDPALVQKCAQYFIDKEQYDKAVDLLAIVKQFVDAIELCSKHNVQLTEDLAEKLTPEKDTVEENLRIRVLETLADSLMVQGEYHLATKKFTQAGDKIRAMKALLKSGDTDKIIFFAGVSRQREIYIMAANYLQSLDWQNQPEILRNIITFYSKGKAMELLANFYVACAQVEIDEFQNYEKAFGALTESSRCLQKIGSAKDPKQVQRASEIVEKRLKMVKKFVDIRRLFERGDVEAGTTQCQQLLTVGDDLESSVRRGDVYALMIQNRVKNGEFVEAKKLCFELRQLLQTADVPVTYYLGKEVIEALAKGLGVPVSHLVPVTPKARAAAEEESYGDAVEEVLDD